jgi:hypothetical protein
MKQLKKNEKKHLNVEQVVEEIYKERDEELKDQLMEIKEDIKSWCLKEKDEPPNYILSITERARQNKEKRIMKE